jgi:hypothetical protein
MTELGLSRGEFAKRLGYKNIAKGIRRIDGLCEGDVEGTKQFLDVLPRALEISAETVKHALDQTLRELELAEKQEAETRDKIWRTVPSPIFVAAIIGVEKLLRIDLDATRGPVSFVRQVLDRAGRGPRVWQTHWVCDQLFPGQGGQVRSKWATNRNPR